MAISVDALLAVILIATLATFGKFALYQEAAPNNLVKMQTMQRTDDVFTTMVNSGYMMDVMDDNGFNSASVQAIYAKMNAMTPSSLGLRIAMRKYDINFMQCRESKTFEACFPDESMSEIIEGGTVPPDTEVLHGRKVFVKQEKPGECGGDYNGGYAQGGIADALWNGILMFAAYGNADINFSIDVSPESELNCDEEADVSLGISVGIGGRDPVDVALVMDRSGSMDDYTMFDRNVLTGQFDDGNKTCNCASWMCSLCGNSWCSWCYTYGNWQTLGTFTIDSNQDTNVTMRYAGYSGGSKPKLRIVSPGGTTYGGTAASVAASYPVQLGTWTAQGWSDDWIDYNVSVYYRKIDVSKDGAQYFVGLADWEEQDQLALVSYNQSATLNQALTTDKNKVWVAINGLSAGGNTATGDAIYKATDELMGGTNQNSDAMKFQVLLSDGQTNTGSSSSAAAQDAKNKGIIIYTIGLGEDVDANELQAIADITGGQYYYANDQNALQELYEIIAGNIGDDASGGYAMTNVIVKIPVPPGTTITDTGNGEFQEGDENFLVFNVGDMEYSSEWQGNYSLVYPCSEEPSCSASEKVFPEEGAYVSYIDVNGIPQNIDWDVNVTLDFLYRDLAIEIIGGEITGENEVYLDVNAKNPGYLDTVATDIKFYLNGTGGDGGEYITSRNVSAMCGGLSEGCDNSSEEFYDIFINKEGYIYAVINEDSENEECPNRNVDSINCYEGAKTQYFTLDYWVWLK
ncbi:MAG: vWA domain-containing protein [Candidatus Diapherotrites archaeon]